MTRPVTALGIQTATHAVPIGTQTLYNLGFPCNDSTLYKALLLTSFYSLIVLGILLSYLPQHHRIISRRSSEGISPYFVLLGTTSGTSAFANIFLVRATLTTFDCCNSGDISEFECFAGVLGVVQISVQWACFAFMYVPPLHATFALGLTWWQTYIVPALLSTNWPG